MSHFQIAARRPPPVDRRLGQCRSNAQNCRPAFTFPHNDNHNDNHNHSDSDNGDDNRAHNRATANSPPLSFHKAAQFSSNHPILI